MLGPTTRQLNRVGTDGNQIEYFWKIRLFDQTPGYGYQYDAWPHPSDATRSIEDRARAYLQVQCASCHSPSGTAPTDIDLRYDTDLQDMNVRFVRPNAGDLGLVDPYIVRPGSKEGSVLWQRDARPRPVPHAAARHRYRGSDRCAGRGAVDRLDAVTASRRSPQPRNQVRTRRRSMSRMVQAMSFGRPKWALPA